MATREKKDDESREDYAMYMLGEAGRILEYDRNQVEGGHQITRTNTLYLVMARDGVNTAREAGSYLDGAVADLRKAIDDEAYEGEMELLQYEIENLAGHDHLSDKERAAVQLRIDAMTNRGNGYNLHIGVGGVPTMDVTGPSFGGRGRGDVRLQFFPDKTMALVDHSGTKIVS